MNKQIFYVSQMTIALTAFFAAPCIAMDGQQESSGGQNTEQDAQQAAQQRAEQLLREVARQAAASLGLGEEQNNEDETTLCRICMKQTEQSARQFLPCTHWACKPCLEGWLRINPSCPVCRVGVPATAAAQTQGTFAPASERYRQILEETAARRLLREDESTEDEMGEMHTSAQHRFIIEQMLAEARDRGPYGPR